MKTTLVAATGLLLLTACGQPAPPPPPDFAAEHKAAMDAFMAGWNTGSVDGLDGAVTEDFERRSPGGMTVSGRDGIKQLMTDMRTSYPDMQVVLDESYHMKDVSFHLWTFTGTNTGGGEMPPTGKSVKNSGATLLRWRDGKIAAEIVQFDALAWQTQLGYTLVPPAGGEAAAE
jgi:predicted ester cyclase